MTHNSSGFAYCNWMHWMVRRRRNRTVTDFDTISAGIVVIVRSETVCAVAAHPAAETLPRWLRMDNRMTFVFEALIVAEAMLVEMIFAFVALNPHWPLVNDSVYYYLWPAMISSVPSLWSAVVAVSATAAAEAVVIVDNDRGHEGVRSAPIQMA